MEKAGKPLMINDENRTGTIDLRVIRIDK